MRIFSYRNLVRISLLATCVSVSAFSRPIVQVVTPEGTVNTIDLGNGRWGVPAGFVGTQSKPIPVQVADAVLFKIGDTFNSFAPGSSEINGLNPQTTFHANQSLIGDLDVLCFGCNGPKPSITILNWQILPLNVPRSMVARVSLGVDASSPNPPFDATNSVLVEVWFARTGSAGNRPPTVSAGSNQTVQTGQTVTLRGTVFDPDGDSTTTLWTLVGGTGSNGIQLNGANSLTATFTAPAEPTILTFQFCANDGEAMPVCSLTHVTVAAPGDDSPPIVLPCTLAGNVPATANAGANRTVNSGETVVIIGSGADPDNSTAQIGGIVVTGVFFQWSVRNAAGLPINLQTNRETLTFVAPMVTVDTTIALVLTVLDPLGCGSEDEIFVTIRASRPADLSITIDDSPDPVVVGDTLTYTFTALNNGPNDATGVTLTVTLPPGVTFISASDSAARSARAVPTDLSKLPFDGRAAVISVTVSAELGDLASGEEAALTIAVKADSVGDLTNNAEVAANEADPDASNNTAAAHTQVLAQPALEPPVDTIPTLSEWGLLLLLIALLGGGIYDLRCR